VPPQTTYAQAACAGWEIGVCATNQNLPSDANIDKLVDTTYFYIRQELLPLLQLVWNHLSFQTGKAQGKSLMEWAGFENVPDLSTLFDILTMPYFG
jgi:hypothetical protein